MRNFNLGALRSWEPVAFDKVIAFDLPGVGFRNVEFEVLATDQVSVYAVSSGEAAESWLVGVGSGHFSIRFTTDETVGIAFFGGDEAEAFIKTQIATQDRPPHRAACEGAQPGSGRWPPEAR